MASYHAWVACLNSWCDKKARMIASIQAHGGLLVDLAMIVGNFTFARPCFGSRANPNTAQHPCPSK
ncbi:MAG: hypothetical protein AB8B55_07770 [Mariniblastus sp.]